MVHNFRTLKKDPAGFIPQGLMIDRFYSADLLASSFVCEEV